MCLGSSKPKTVTVEKPVVQEVEKVKDPEPVPQTVTPTDTTNQQLRSEQEKKKNRNKQGYAATRVADRAVLTDTADKSGSRQTLG